MRRLMSLSATLLALTSCTAIYDYELPEDVAEPAGCTNNDDCPIQGQVCQADGSCATPEPQSVRFGFLYPGSVGDHGWVKAHDDARRAVDEALADVTSTFVPNVFSGNDVLEAFETLRADGVNVIIGGSFDHVETLQALADDNPDVKFLMCSGFVTGSNYGSYFGRMYQAKWLAGRLAGQMTQTNRIGYIGPFAFPETVRHVNAFTEGVRSVNPDAVVMVEWLSAWFDPETEELRAQQMLDLDVDVLHGSTDAPVSVTIAEGKTTPTDGLPVYSIGYDNENTCEVFGPENCITSVYWNWTPLLQRQIEEIRDGTWDPAENPWVPLKANPDDSIAAMTSPSTSLVSIPIRGDVEAFIPRFANGDIDAFDDVTMDNKGQPRTVEDDADMLEMCWFVPGVVVTSAPPFQPAVVPNSCQGAR
jgi:basic membrane protein A